jgi:hypothetical protein
MKKRIALLAMVAAILLFTIALVAFSVYTVNAATVSTVAVYHPAAVNSLVSVDSLKVSDVSSITTDSGEVSVQHLGTECHGDAVDDYAY